MPAVIYIIQPYARRGERIAALTPITTTEEDYATSRAQQLASAYGNCGAVVFAETVADEGGLIGEPVVVARFRTTPDDP
jgi:hypothetical protein